MLFQTVGTMKENARRAKSDFIVHKSGKAVMSSSDFRRVRVISLD